MIEAWLIEILRGTSKIFLHPVFYFSIILAGLLGIRRVKRERRDFNTRIHDAYLELRYLFSIGILVGLFISIVTLVVGIPVPFAAIILIGLFTVLFSLTTHIRLLSPAYTVGFAFFALIFIGNQEGLTIPFFQTSFSAIDEKVYPSVALLLALLIIGEAILILKNGSKKTSPKLVKSKRGFQVGIHEAKRLWVVPVFLLIPGDPLQAMSWWPVFSIGDTTYSIFLVPFAVGFSQKIQGMLPKESIRFYGLRIIWLGLIATGLAIVGYFVPIVSIITVALIIIGRATITLLQRLKEETLPFYYSRQNQGLMILDIIPDSPAYRMALKTGELITKVNGIAVQDEKGFYEALQRNGAYCKLEVFDVNGQVRFVQRALYEGDHYELGILFIEEKKWDQAAGE
ncbi:PDZ domain-containing protein [Bacillus aquiflavi]|uniref:PDZ domain-containing protein n=1 Tax=Bacillus aquiflavi TaxID=2672567 RepID=A0A6B3VX09_9BACI|nr:PDZ domain-containing protein [Bacillus aquiflavi]MBA4537541.1 PDZ domain-containing protein [Bacillus aquiflavi]NEY81798.1 PDZ domain-containing protein [Bacillus aquiflavi]